MANSAATGAAPIWFIVGLLLLSLSAVIIISALVVMTV